MKRSLLSFLLILSMALSGQNLKLVTEDDIPGLQLTNSVFYSNQDLRNYSGSTADLILEFGFRALNVYDYSFQNEKVRLEVYTMEDAPSAFGIYSVSVSHCLLWNRWSTFSCTNQNQIAAALGPYLLNIRDMNKIGSGQSLCEQIIQQIITKNPQESWYMPPLFQSPKLGRYINTLKYTEGPKGIAAVAPQLLDLFEDLQYNCFTVDITDRGQVGILARIQFPDFNSMDRFRSNAGLNNDQQTGPVMSMNGLYRSWYKINDTKLLYLECSTPNVKLSDIIPDRPDLYGGW
ncbi:MAG: hypothetical protein NTU98_09100 [Bacteroidetes bacterium]|nr:hypothetical protein [Bacteroidota bacterium]